MNKLETRLLSIFIPFTKIITKMTLILSQLSLFITYEITIGIFQNKKGFAFLFCAVNFRPCLTSAVK